MCGFAVAINYKGCSNDLKEHFDRIQYRGPDNTQHRSFDEDVHFSFYRLAIMDLTDDGNQPMCHPDDSDLILVCNGEIYNHTELKERYQFNFASESDSEIILHMYKKWGLKRTLYELDGVFAFVLFDRKKNVFHAARDPFGVRPAFWGYDDNGALFIASEAKAMSDIVSKVHTFTPGHSMSFYKWQLRAPTVDSYFTYPVLMSEDVEERELLTQIRQRLTRAVQKRLMSDRPIGCLLSGGLDSSLIAALVNPP